MRVLIAIAISLVIHVAVGLILWFYLEYAPAPDTFATLDPSSVELSFAEEDDDTAAELPQMSMPRPKVETSPKPKVDAAPEPLPEIPDSVDIPRPKEQEKLPEPPPQPSVSAPAPKQARIDAPPRPKRTIRPDYPKGSRQRGEQGDVVVEMLVNAQGTVDNAKIVSSSGFPELDEAAIRAVRFAKFTPAKAGSESVASTARITLTFKLK